MCKGIITSLWIIVYSLEAVMCVCVYIYIERVIFICYLIPLIVATNSIGPGQSQEAAVFLGLPVGGRGPDHQQGNMSATPAPTLKVIAQYPLLMTNTDDMQVILENHASLLVQPK